MQEINAFELLKFYAKSWFIILSFTITGLILGFIYNSHLQTPLYKSSATLFVINSDHADTSKSTTLINNYIELFKSRRVLEPAMEEQKLDVSYDELKKSVDVTNEKSTDVIKVSISTKDPKVSERLTEKAVKSFKEQVAQLYGSDNIRVVDTADLADEAYNVRPHIQLVLAASAGFIISLVILFFTYDLKLGNRDTKKSSKPKKSFFKVVDIKQSVKAVMSYVKTLFIKLKISNIKFSPAKKITKKNLSNSSVMKNTKRKNGTKIKSKK